MDIDLAAIRRAAETRDAYFRPELVMALVERCERAERDARHTQEHHAWLGNAYADVHAQLESLLLAARAYFDAVDRCDGIAAVEQALRAAVEAASEREFDR